MKNEAHRDLQRIYDALGLNDGEEVPDLTSCILDAIAGMKNDIKRLREMAGVKLTK